MPDETEKEIGLEKLKNGNSRSHHNNKIKVLGPNETEIILSVTDDLWDRIPQDKRGDQQYITQFLNDALKIGILATVNASITIDTKRIEQIIENATQSYETQSEHAKEELEDLLTSNLTGDDSLFITRLLEIIGPGGNIDSLLKDFRDNLANPENTNSVPYATREVLLNSGVEVKDLLEKALDITDENTAIGRLVRQQTKMITDLEKYFELKFQDLFNEMGISELRLQNEAQLEEARQCSTGKGLDFEIDAVDALQDVAGLFGDTIVHTGGVGVAGSTTKIGDIIIKINSPGVPEIIIAIEAKSGSSITRRSLIKQTSEAVESRGAVCGIGLMERKHMGKRQHVVEQVGENYLVGVEWDKDKQDFFALEVIYRMLRIQLITEAMRMNEGNGIDSVGVRKFLTDAKTKVGDLGNIRGGLTSARNTIDTQIGFLDTLRESCLQDIVEAERLLFGGDEGE